MGFENEWFSWATDQLIDRFFVTSEVYTDVNWVLLKIIYNTIPWIIN